MKYPKRPPFFAMRYQRLLFHQCAAMVMGPNAALLCCVVAQVEDSKHYTGPVTFWNDQLAVLLGVSVRHMRRARERAIEAGWLHYQKGAKGRAAAYHVVIPEEVQDVPDPILGEGNEPIRGAGVQESDEIRGAGVQELEIKGAGVQENSAFVGHPRPKCGQQSPGKGAPVSHKQEYPDTGARNAPGMRPTFNPTPTPKSIDEDDVAGQQAERDLFGDVVDSSRQDPKGPTAKTAMDLRMEIPQISWRDGAEAMWQRMLVRYGWDDVTKASRALLTKIRRDADPGQRVVLFPDRVLELIQQVRGGQS